jgi:hypothetical protein
MECAKSFQITVDAVPPVLFDWPAALLSGVATFTPELSTGNTAVAFANGNTIDGVGGSQNAGEFIWNSNAALPVNMHVETVSTGANPDPTITAAITVSVVAPFSSLLIVQAGVDIGFNAIADFPFNLPDTGGVNLTIQWFQSTVVTPNPGNDGTMNLTGVLTVV